MKNDSRVALPQELDLPLFAYGLFKPGQLGFFRIREFVESAPVQSKVAGRLKERDGVPLLVPGESGSVKGVTLSFRRGATETAYRRIAEIEPGEVYKWQTVSAAAADGAPVLANALVGRRDRRGSTEPKNIEEWEGRDDPYFGSALDVVKEVLDGCKQFDGEDMRPLFRLQMAYSLLWSALERYASLRYHLGEKVMAKVLQIAGEPAFAEALAEVVDEDREIFSTTNLDRCKLDSTNPISSIKYYYQIRSNSVHRGKAVVGDFGTVRRSLEELLRIFHHVITAAFKEAGADLRQPTR